MDFSIGDNVFLAVPLPYLKTAAHMPMLRPADLVSPEEMGEIIGLDTSNIAKVRFRRGVFLIPMNHLSKNINQDENNAP